MNETGDWCLNICVWISRDWLVSSGFVTIGSVGIFIQMRSTCLFHIQLCWNLSWNCSGPICSSKIPDSHLDFPWKFILFTTSPIWNILSHCFLSINILVSSTLVVTWPDKSGYIKSRWDLACWPICDSATLVFRKSDCMLVYKWWMWSVKIK